MSEVLTELVAKITTDAAGLKSGLSDATSSVDKWAQKNQRSISAVGKAFVALGAVITGAMAFAVKSAVDYESAFAGVRKTVDATEEEFATLSKGIIDLSKQLPVAATEIAGVTEAAGQLGIQNESLLSFTKVMIGLGMATNLAGEDAAKALARFANITQMSQNDFDRLGSVIVELGNNLATTEAEIVDMAMRIAGAGTVAGMTESQIMALSGALSSLGLRSEQGGTAISRVILGMSSAISSGSEELKVYADTAGVSIAEFSTLFREDASNALMVFLSGVGNLRDQGADVSGIFDELALSGVRVEDVLLRASGATNVLTEAQELAAKAWEDNLALTEEVEKRTKTAASQFALLKNTITAFAIKIGDNLVPVLVGMVKIIKPIVEWVGKWVDEHPQLVQWLTIFTAAIGVLSLAFGGFLLLLPTILAGLSALGITFSAAIWPITAIVALIGGLIAIGILVVKNWDVIKVTLLNAIDSILGGLQKFLGFIPGLKDKIGDARESIAKMIDSDKVKQEAEKVKKTNKELVETLKEQATELTNTLKAEAQNQFQSQIDGLNKRKEAAQKTYDDEVENIKKTYGVAEDTSKSLIQLAYDQRDAELRAIDDAMDAFENAHKKRLNDIEKEYQANVRAARATISEQERAIQDQIEAIDDLTSAEDLAATRAEEKEKLTNLKSLMDLAETEEDKLKTTEDYLEYKADVERKELLRSRNDVKDALRQQLQDLRDSIDEETASLKAQRDRELEAEKLAYQEAWDTEKLIWDEKETTAKTNLANEITRLETKRETLLKELDTAYNGEGGVFPTLAKEETTLKENFTNQIARMDAELKKFKEDNTAKLEDSQNFVRNLNAALSQIQDASYIVTRYERTVSEGGTSPGIATQSHAIPSFATGGIVPGPIGMPQLAMVHGGETVIPANESMGNIVVNFSQPVFFDREDTMNKFVDMISKGIDRKQRLRFGGAYNG